MEHGAEPTQASCDTIGEMKEKEEQHLVPQASEKLAKVDRLKEELARAIAEMEIKREKWEQDFKGLSPTEKLAKADSMIEELARATAEMETKREKLEQATRASAGADLPGQASEKDEDGWAKNLPDDTTQKCGTNEKEMAIAEEQRPSQGERASTGAGAAGMEDSSRVETTCSVEPALSDASQPG